MKKVSKLISILLSLCMLASLTVIGASAANITMNDLATYLNGQQLSNVNFAGDDTNHKLTVTLYNETTLQNANSAIDQCVSYLISHQYSKATVAANQAMTSYKTSDVTLSTSSSDLAEAVFKAVCQGDTSGFLNAYSNGSVSGYLAGKTVYLQLDGNTSTTYAIEFYVHSLSQLAAYMNNQSLSNVSFTGNDTTKKLTVTLYSGTTLANANSAMDTCVAYLQSHGGYTKMTVAANQALTDYATLDVTLSAASSDLAAAVYKAINQGDTTGFQSAYQSGSVSGYLNGKTIYVKLDNDSTVYAVTFALYSSGGGTSGGTTTTPGTTTTTTNNSDGSTTTTQTTTASNSDGSTTTSTTATTTAKDGAKTVIATNAVSTTNTKTGTVTTVATTTTTKTDTAGQTTTAKTANIAVSATGNTASVDASAVKTATAAGVTAAQVTVKTDVATVTFDNSATQALASATAAQAGDNTTTTLSVNTQTVAQDKLTADQKETIGTVTGNTVILDLSVVVTTTNTSTGAVVNQETISKFGDSGKVTVTVPYTPKGDSSDITVYYIDSKGKAQKMENCSYDPATGCITFTTSHFSTYVVAEEATASFMDVSLSDWFYSYVNTCVEKGYMNGVATTSFDPNGNADRAMMVTVLYRMAGSPQVNAATPFTDVKSGQWYSNAIAWAYQQKITEGISDTEFGLNTPLNREMTVTFFYRFAQYMNYDVSKTDSLSAYTDTNEISSFADVPFQWACNNGIINGVGNNKLAPQGVSSRAQMATMLARFNQNIKN